MAASQERADIEGSVAELVSGLQTRMSALADQVTGRVPVLQPWTSTCMLALEGLQAQIVLGVADTCVQDP